MATPPKRRRRRPAAATAPNVHALLIYGCFGLTMGGLLGHGFFPEDRLYEWLVISGIAAFFGKASNGFGKSQIDLLRGAHRESDRDPEPDEEEEEIDGREDG